MEGLARRETEHTDRIFLSFSWELTQLMSTRKGCRKKEDMKLKFNDMPIAPKQSRYKNCDCSDGCVSVLTNNENASRLYLEVKDTTLIG